MKRKRTAAAPPDRSIRIQAYEHVRQMILQGELPPESLVSELAIAEKLGSSRTPVREALGQLVAEGLLQQTPNRGTTVVRFNRQDIVDLYELREALEAYAARKAASLKPLGAEMEQWRSVTRGILALRDELARTALSALDAEQMQQFISIDYAFHTMLMHLGGNARMVKVVNDSRLLVRIFIMGREAYSTAQLDALYRQHEEIIDAVDSGDQDRAASTISAHIRTSLQERLVAFESWERTALLKKNIPAFFPAWQTPG
jgi:DNA-binding GntR family transcriptional regulator